MASEIRSRRTTRQHARGCVSEQRSRTAAEYGLDQMKHAAWLKSSEGLAVRKAAKIAKDKASLAALAGDYAQYYEPSRLAIALVEAGREDDPLVKDELTRRMMPLLTTTYRYQLSNPSDRNHQ